MPNPPKKHYVDTKVLEAVWTEWLDSEGSDIKAWDSLCSMIYRICEGISVHFNPANEDEQLELIHETFTQTITKIQDGRLKFKPGKAPVFNLLTTTIIRQLYSLMNKRSRRRRLHEKYKILVVDQRFPESRSLLVRH